MNASLAIRIFAVLIAFTMSPSASFSETVVGDAFSTGVAAFKAGKYDEARKSFLELELKHPGDPTLLLNLGLIAQKEKRLGAALGLWRKGLVQHPTDEALSNAVDWLKPKLAKTEISHEIELWEQFRPLLARVSPMAVTVVAAVFLLLAGWMILRWWGARARAIELETAMPAMPTGGIVLSILFLLMFGISVSIFIDRLDIRGTIIATKSEARSAPDATATALFDVFEGMEVIVRDSRIAGKEQWRRISYPGGMTGWIRERDVLTSADPSALAWEQ